MEKTEEEQKAATKQAKRKTPSSDLRDQVAKFARAMDSALDEILELFEEYAIPDDWCVFHPCGEGGQMYWKWKRGKWEYFLYVTASANRATVENCREERLELVSLARAVRRLRRMMDDDEEEDDEEEEED